MRGHGTDEAFQCDSKQEDSGAVKQWGTDTGAVGQNGNGKRGGVSMRKGDNGAVCQ